jgi:hypothetical protein
MKKIFRNNRLIAIAFFTVFTAGTASVAMANNSNYVIPVELKLVGSIKNQPLFELSFAGNPDHDEFTIIIRDEAGNSLYRENIKGENFTKKFLLNTDEIGDEILHFEVISRKSKKTVVYEVNRTSRFVEEMVVSEMK